jgi:hypothetical protein
MFFVLTLNSSEQFLELCLKIHHDRFLLHHFQYVTRLSSHYCRYIATAVDKALLNRRAINKSVSDRSVGKTVKMGNKRGEKATGRKMVGETGQAVKSAICDRKEDGRRDRSGR